MFLNFSTLKEDPFKIAPDPRFLYLSEQHAKARMYISSANFLANGFVVVTGDVGAGKTILVRDFLSSLSHRAIPVEIHQTQITPVQFLKMFLAELGFEAFDKKKAELLNMANNFLLRSRKEGRHTVLVIDEAQHLSLSVLEEIRLLAGLESADQPALSIILAGQPQFQKTVTSPQMEQFAQRTPLHFHLSAFDRSDTEGYIKHRLSVAGDSRNQIFLPETFDIIYQHTSGVPRLINTLCNTAMLCAFADDQDVVSANTVRVTIEELYWAPYETAKNSELLVDEIKAGSNRVSESTSTAGKEQIKRAAMERAQAMLAEAKRAEARRAEAERMLQEKNKEINRLQSDLDNKVTKVGQLESEIEKLRANEIDPQQQVDSAAELRRETQALSNTINALKAEAEARKSNNILLGRQFEKASTQNARLASELDSKEELVKNYEQDIKKLRESMQKAKGQRTTIFAATAASSARTESKEIRLLACLDDEAANKHPVTTGQLCLGSGVDNDIQIISEFISRHHAQIISSPTVSVLCDLNSSNGTFVNSRRVRKHALRNGDVITIGKHRFKYITRKPGPARSSTDMGYSRIRRNEGELSSTRHATPENQE